MGRYGPAKNAKLKKKRKNLSKKQGLFTETHMITRKSIWSPEHIGEPIIITCPKHGDWNSGMYHIKASGQKAGCPKCAHENVNKHRVEEARKSFAKKARSIHGKNYDYERVEYINNHTPVDIFCRKHQLFFSQIPNSHLNGAGCPECALEKIRENRIESLEGKVFGKLKVIRFDHKRKRKTRQGNSFHRYWLCKCECGKEKVIFQTQLTTGNTISCGCNKYDNLINAEISALHDPEVAEIETELYFVEVGKIFHKFGISIHSAEIRGGKDYTKIYWRYRDRRDVVVPVESVLHSMTKDYFDIERIAEEDFDRWPGWTELRCQLDTSFWIRKPRNHSQSVMRWDIKNSSLTIWNKPNSFIRKSYNDSNNANLFCLSSCKHGYS